MQTPAPPTPATPVTPSVLLATLRMADLTKKLSACRGTIYEIIKDPAAKSPVAFSYGGRGVYYFAHEVDAWLLRQQAINPLRPSLSL
jgi:predicted DNA-binding transcriptional regulator AlpA